MAAVNVNRKAVVVGISGCSSSGKTTLARLLRDIFPNTFILHEDDFYKPDQEIPIKDGLADWDCPEAIELSDMVKALEYIRSHGAPPVSQNPHLSHRTDHGRRKRPCSVLTYPSSHLPVSQSVSPPSSPLTSVPSAPPPPSLLTDPLAVQPDLFSKEDKNSVGACPVPETKIAALKAKVAAWVQPGQPGHEALLQRHQGAATEQLSLCILDGFLLYTDAMRPAMDLLDVRLFLRVSHAKATHRRHARDGYVTLDGFWQDPPGYMDKIVWPNYVETHRWMFPGGDVEAEPDQALLQANHILTQVDKGVDVDMETTLEWAVDTLMRELLAFWDAP